MRVVGHITCHACGERISELEPDIVLRKADGSVLRFFHAERSCAEASRRACSEGAQRTPWSLTRRHLFWDTGGGSP